MAHRRIGALSLITAALAFFIFTPGVGAQNEGLDPAFKTGAGTYDNNDPVVKTFRQPDGKTVIYGTFDMFGGIAQRKIFRVNVDYSVDSTFAAEIEDDVPISAALQPDGRIVVTASALGPEKLYRLNSDGSLDPSFTDPLAGTLHRFPTVHAVQADGKIYVEDYNDSNNRRTLYRLNPDGSPDNTFSIPQAIGDHESFRQVTVLPDGKILIGGAHDYGELFRINADGSKDLTFAVPVLVTSGWELVTGFIAEPDGKITFTGDFTTVNGLARNYLARLNADGGVDQQFAPITPFGTGPSITIKRLSNGQYMVGKGMTGGTDFARMNYDGTRDNTYDDPNNVGNVNDWHLDSLERVVFDGTYENNKGFFRLNSDGSLDSPFLMSIGLVSRVKALAAQPDGKMMVLGDFRCLGNGSRDRLGRLNANGTLDTSFTLSVNLGSNFEGEDVAVQPDGKILTLTTIQHRLQRFTATGTVDPTLDLNTGSAATMAVQPDGKILLGGGSLSVNGFSRTGIARVNPDGTTDSAFNPLLANPSVKTIVLQPDGKIVIGGSFTSVNGTARPNIARLNADGSLDAAFAPAISAGVTRIVRMSDGRLFVASTNVVRIKTDGSPDPTFSPFTQNAGGVINALAIGAGNDIVIGGSFTAPRKNIARLSQTGYLYPSFAPDGADKMVEALASTPNGRVVIGGQFKKIGTIARVALAKTQPPTAFDFDGDARADISLTRPSEFNWYQSIRYNFEFFALHFGASGDRVAPGDYDGDGITDIAIFRPGSGDWWYQGSADNQPHSRRWGQKGDVPIPSDLDGDGKTDFVVVRVPEYTWYGFSISSGWMLGSHFGAPGDVPLAGDFDGDGKGDMAVFRPSEGNWYYLRSSDGEVFGFHWGSASDVPVPADYDGDGKTDLAVFRPAEGNWYILGSTAGFMATHFGLSADRPVPADYDGDGQADIAVFRPSEGNWYLLRSSEGFFAFHFGLSGDIPSQAAFLPENPPPLPGMGRQK